MLSVSNAIQDLSPSKTFMQRIRRSGNHERSIELTEKTLQERGHRTIIPIIQSAVARIRAIDKNDQSGARRHRHDGYHRLWRDRSLQCPIGRQIGLPPVVQSGNRKLLQTKI